MIQGSLEKLKINAQLDFFEVLKSWPEDQALLALGGRGSDCKMIALAFDEVQAEEFLQHKLSRPCHVSHLPKMAGGYVACLDYGFSQGSGESRYFKVHQCLCYEGGEVYLYTEDKFHSAQYRVALDGLQPRELPFSPIEPASWKARWTKEEYLQRFSQCQGDILDGRYYQINLLQYYQLKSDLSTSQLLGAFCRWSEPFSAWVRLPSWELVSLSPERFFRVHGTTDRLKIEAQPIKGTIPVDPDPRVNAENKRILEASEKDQAELHMIVDLMRNDINRIAKKGSVRVEDPGSLHSFAKVHHLIARVQANLPDYLCLNDLLMALCPGGSITGAPKVEVMKAIREYEGVSRGFFMGNICYYHPDHQYLDSSILIRTFQRVSGSPYHFAAGSGLTINSQGDAEWQEIAAKASVLVP